MFKPDKNEDPNDTNYMLWKDILKNHFYNNYFFNTRCKALWKDV